MGVKEGERRVSARIMGRARGREGTHHCEGEDQRGRGRDCQLASRARKEGDEAGRKGGGDVLAASADAGRRQRSAGERAGRDERGRGATDRSSRSRRTAGSCPTEKPRRAPCQRRSSSRKAQRGERGGRTTHPRTLPTTLDRRSHWLPLYRPPTKSSDGLLSPWDESTRVQAGVGARVSDAEGSKQEVAAVGQAGKTAHLRQQQLVRMRRVVPDRPPEDA